MTRVNRLCAHTHSLIIESSVQTPSSRKNRFLMSMCSRPTRNFINTQEEKDKSCRARVLSISSCIDNSMRAYYLLSKSLIRKYNMILFMSSRFGFKIDELNIENKKNNYKKHYHLFFHHAMP